MAPLWLKVPPAVTVVTPLIVLVPRIRSSVSLSVKLLALTTDPEALREDVLKDYLLLYAQIGGTIYLLAIRHQRQLSIDFEGHWR